MVLGGIDVEGAPVDASLCGADDVVVAGIGEPHLLQNLRPSPRAVPQLAQKFAILVSPFLESENEPNHFCLRSVLLQFPSHGGAWMKTTLTAANIIFITIPNVSRE